jgi:hypothetical protein
MRIGLGVERARGGRDESHENKDDGTAHGRDGVSDGAGAPGAPSTSQSFWRVTL